MSARNAFSLLSRADPSLTAIKEDLLLTEHTVDRLTLPPEDAKRVSDACITLIRRIGPVLSIPAAQVMLEWITVYLNVAVAGTKEEIETLLVSLLPYHTMNWYPKALQNIITKDMREWTWLNVARKTDRPIGIDLMRRICTTKALELVLRVEVSNANDGIRNGFMSRFLVSVGAWRLVSLNDEQRVAFASSLLQKTADFLKLDVVRQKSALEFGCAVITILSVIVKCGLTEELRRGIAITVNRMFRIPIKELRSTAVSCLHLLVEQGLGFLKNADDVLDFAGINNNLRMACLRGLLLKKKGSKEIIRKLRENLKGLNEKNIEEILTQLLRLVSGGGSWEPEAMKDELAEFINYLGRGVFAESVDRSLRSHFEGRKQKNKEANRLIDEIITKALSGTNLALGDKSSMEAIDSPESLLRLLGHPESSVRKFALDRVIGDEQLREAVNENNLLSNKCVDMIRSDENTVAAGKAASCLSLLPLPASEDILRHIITRFCKELEVATNKKKVKTGRKNTVAALANVLVHASKHYQKQDIRQAKAIVIGLVISSANGGSNMYELEREHVISIFSQQEGQNTVNTKRQSSENVFEEGKDVVASYISDASNDLAGLTKQLVSWNNKWACNVVQLWLNKILQLDALRDKMIAKALMECVECVSTNDGDLSCSFAVAVLMKAVYVLQKIEVKSLRKKLLGRLWLLAQGHNDDITVKIISALVGSYGLGNTVKLLQRCITNAAIHESARKNTLRWYFGLCESCVDTTIQERAVMTTLYAFYGDNAALREEVQYLCLAMRKISSTEGNLFRQLISCISGICKLGEVHKNHPILMSRHSSLLESTTLSSIRLKVGHDVSLNILGEQDHFSDLIDVVINKICRDEEQMITKLFLLRASEGTKRVSLTQANRLLKLLQVSQEYFTNEASHSELLLRVSALIPIEICSNLDVDAVQETVHYFANKLEILDESKFQDPKLSLSQEAFVQVAAKLLEISSVVRHSQRVIKSKNLILGHLLAVSTRSSPAGRCARRILDEIAMQHVDTFVPFITMFAGVGGSRSKRRRLNPQHRITGFNGVPPLAGLGVIETMKRILSTDGQDVSIFQEVVKSLWVLSKSILDVYSSTEICLNEEQEYHLELIFSVLASFYKALQGCGLGISEEDLDSLVNATDKSGLVSAIFYAITMSQDDQTALRSSVRLSAVAVAEALECNHSGVLPETLSNTVEKLINDKKPMPIKFIHRLVPVLLKYCDTQRVCKWITCWSFEVAQPNGIPDEYVKLISSCVTGSETKEFSNKECVRVFAECAKEFAPLAVAAHESARVIVATQQKLIGKLQTIEAVGADLFPETALNFFLNEQVMDELTVDVQTNRAEGLDKALTIVLLKLVKVTSATDLHSTHESVSYLLKLAPLQVISCTMVQLIGSEDLKISAKAMSAFLERFEDLSHPLRHLWALEGHGRANDDIQTRAEQELCKHVGGVLTQKIRFGLKLLHSNKPGALNGSDYVELALRCLIAMMRTAKSAENEILSNVGRIPKTVLEELETSKTLSNPDENRGTSLIITSTLRFASALLLAIGEGAIHVISTVLPLATDILVKLEGAKKTSVIIRHLVNSASALCETTLNTDASLFGRDATVHIANAALGGNGRICNDILLLAAEQMSVYEFVLPMQSIMSSIGKRIFSCQGLAKVLDAMTTKILRGNDVDVRTTARTSFKIAMACMEQSRRKILQGHSSVASETSEDSPEIVDKAFVRVLSIVSQALAESEFEKEFDNLFNWVESSMPSEIHQDIEGEEVDIVAVLSRAIPFSKLSLQLHKDLNIIYIPYSIKVQGRFIHIVSQGYLAASTESEVAHEQKPHQSKKRPRRIMQSENSVAGARKILEGRLELFKVALRNITAHLKQDLPEHLVTPSMVSRVQDCLTAAFDKQGKETADLTNAFSALAVRIASAGRLRETRVESGDLLKGLVQEILIRTRSENVELRKGALRICKSAGESVGHDFVETLVEAMPFLADVIDDESDNVRKEAKGLVRVFEELTGNTIMDSLKS